jgi:hypothetical protein
MHGFRPAKEELLLANEHERRHRQPSEFLVIENSRTTSKHDPTVLEALKQDLGVFRALK